MEDQEYHDLNAEKNPQRPWIFLLAMFFGGTVVRFTLAYYFRHAPMIQIDESLYINIAKSLAAGEGISYRSQPIPYMYIFYPLMLVPLYLFPLPFDLYRVVQLYNSFLICSSVFPIYLFAKDFVGSNKKALISAAISLLMPDMMMAGLLMSECVVWPLSLWIIFFSYRLFTTKQNPYHYGILAGLFTALLFWTKPGSMIMGIIQLLAALLLSKGSQHRNRRNAAFAGISVCAVCILFFYVLYTFVFGYDFSVLGLYQKQLTPVSDVWVTAVAEFSILQLILFAIASGGLFFVLPYACKDNYTQTQKTFLLTLSAGLVVIAIGTAAFVDMQTWNGSFTDPQLHLRYMAMYIPIMVTFSLGTSLQTEKKNQLPSFLVIMAVLTIFPGATVGFSSNSSTYMDSVALSAWIDNFHVPAYVGVILTAVTALFLIFLAWTFFRNHSFNSLHNLCLGFLVFFLICNNVCGYIACGAHVDTNNYSQDAVEMNHIVESLPQDVLIVTQQHYNETVSYLLESRIRRPLQQVTIDVFLKALEETNGIYVPFIPVDQDPNVGNHITPETNTFLFGINVMNHLELSDDAIVKKTQNGWFSLVQVDTCRRIIDTAISGLDMDLLPENETAEFLVFNPSHYVNGKLTLHLIASATEESAELMIENAGKTELISLTEKPKTCLISLRQGETTITALNGHVNLYSYWT